MRSSRLGRAYGRPERLDGDGAVRITQRELALLQGLLDRAGATVRSYAEWIEAAMPYLPDRYPQTLRTLAYAGTYSVADTWVVRRRLSSGRVQVTLAPRGRAILELVVFCRIQGYGVYRGLRLLRGA